MHARAADLPDVLYIRSPVLRRAFGAGQPSRHRIVEPPASQTQSLFLNKHLNLDQFPRPSTESLRLGTVCFLDQEMEGRASRVESRLWDGRKRRDFLHFL